MVSPSYVHSSSPAISVAVVGGHNYWVQAIWATAPGLLQEPPVGVRTPANYLESPPLWVGKNTPTHAAPAIIRAEPAWWQGARDRERTLWARVSWRAKETSPWVLLTTIEFIVNHAPEAVVVPDQVVALDAADAVAADVRLDGTASSDPDQAAASNPAGPLAFRWAAVQTPPGLWAGGAVAAAANGLASIADPLFLAVGTLVPGTDRGAYSFRLTVDDQERASIGARAGQSRTATTDARVFLAVPATFGVSLVSPTTGQPCFGNFEDGVDAVIACRVSSALTGHAAYAAGWRLKCTITQSLPSPMAFSNPAGTIVYETTMVPVPDRVELIRWDGREPGSGGLPAVGAFDVRLELLNAAGMATGVGGAAATEARCIVLDYVRWLLPIETAASQAARSGSFMESGHAGFAATGLHGGIDLVRRPAGQPAVLAARSGRYRLVGGATNAIELQHAPPDRTRYLHGDMLTAHVNGELIVQGGPLARMAHAGTVGVHLHFEHWTDAAAAVLENPQTILALWDAFPPEVDAVYVRAASAAGGEARLANAATGIAGQADLIIRCRDRSHPGHDSPADSSPYRVVVVERPVPVAVWPEARFDQLTAADHVRNYYEQQSLAALTGLPADAITHYLRYLRWDTAPYGQQAGPLRLDILVSDHDGQLNTLRFLTLGPNATVVTPPPTPATNSANPQPFTLEIQVTNQMSWLNDNAANNTSFVSTDNFHIRLAGAPAGWTVAPARTGPIGNGATAANPQGGQPPPQHFVLTVDPHGAAPAGMQAFWLVVSSDILLQVGVRLPVTAVVS